MGVPLDHPNFTRISLYKSTIQLLGQPHDELETPISTKNTLAINRSPSHRLRKNNLRIRIRDRPRHEKMAPSFCTFSNTAWRSLRLGQNPSGFVRRERTSDLRHTVHGSRYIRSKWGYHVCKYVYIYTYIYILYISIYI